MHHTGGSASTSVLHSDLTENTFANASVTGSNAESSNPHEHVRACATRDPPYTTTSVHVVGHCVFTRPSHCLQTSPKVITHSSCTRPSHCLQNEPQSQSRSRRHITHGHNFGISNNGVFTATDCIMETAGEQRTLLSRAPLSRTCCRRTGRSPTPVCRRPTQRVPPHPHQERAWLRDRAAATRPPWSTARPRSLRQCCPQSPKRRESCQTQSHRRCTYSAWKRRDEVCKCAS